MLKTKQKDKKKQEKNKKKQTRKKRKEKVYLWACINNCEKSFWNCGAGLSCANSNSWKWRQRCSFPRQITFLSRAHLSNRRGDCQIPQETGEWAPTQDAAGLNFLHSIKYMRAPFISQPALLRPKSPAFAKDFHSLLHSFGVVSFLKPHVS